MIKKIRNLQKGFTLVELLIVIAIIGILSALLMANFIGVRQRARDAQRKADLRQIQSASELYRSDLGAYPDNTKLSSCGGQLDDGGNPAAIYMKKIPCDPLDNTTPYYYAKNGQDYDLIACLENLSDLQADQNQTNGTNNDTICTISKASITFNSP